MRPHILSLSPTNAREGALCMAPIVRTRKFVLRFAAYTNGDSQTRSQGLEGGAAT